MPEHLYITLSLYPMTMWVGHWVTNGDEEDGDATDNNNDTTILFTTLVLFCVWDQQQPNIILVYIWQVMLWLLDLAWITLLCLYPAASQARPLDHIHTLAPPTTHHPLSAPTNMPHIQMSKVMISQSDHRAYTIRIMEGPGYSKDTNIFPLILHLFLLCEQTSWFSSKGDKFKTKNWIRIFWLSTFFTFKPSLNLNQTLFSNSSCWYSQNKEN